MLRGIKAKRALPLGLRGLDGSDPNLLPQPANGEDAAKDVIQVHPRHTPVRLRQKSVLPRIPQLIPISHIIFHAVLSMMHTLSYLALGHILIWRKLQPLDGLLKSGQAFSTEVREEEADRTAPPSDDRTAAVSPCSIF